MKAKKIVQKAKFSKSNVVPWGNLETKINQYGVDKVVHLATEVHDDNSASYIVHIYLNPEELKGGESS